MCRSRSIWWAVLFCSFATGAGAAPAEERWLLAIDRWGNPEYRLLVLQRSGNDVSGRLGAWPVEGRLSGRRLAVVATDGRGGLHRLEAGIDGDGLAGMADYPDTNDPLARARHGFRGRRLADAPAAAGSVRRFVPTAYSNEFTAHREPVMTLWPGDVIVTTTLDSGGVDHAGRTQALYGNPQTGPFFIADAEPGDVLAVRIRRLRLDRDYADSLDGFVGRAMTASLAAQAASLGGRLRWRLDREAGVARLEDPPPRLKDFEVPLRPMLGGIGVAPDFGFAPQSTGGTGRFGGNMDFNGVVEGVTVYLPVFQPGALLYLGDGHALQGDGETTQWALETSLEVEFSVDVLRSRALATPRVESADRLTAIGQAATLDDAAKAATAGMVQWLAQDYGLDARESSLVLGTAAEYRVATLAGQNVGMALSLPRKLLEALPPKDRAAGSVGSGQQQGPGDAPQPL